MEKVIEVNGLSKQYKEVLAVNSLDLNVYRGDVFGFLGPNGAGKSTTIRMLLSLIFPTAGNIKIFDKALNKHRNEILRRVGAIVEKPDFYLNLTAMKNLDILGRVSGIDITKDKIMDILELVGLAHRAKSKVKTFSHGMKQRLGLAQTLLHDPELIILDEPTTGLDPQGMKEIRELIISLSKEHQKTILLSSHILSEVEQVADRMIIINKGATVVEGTVEELLDSSELRVKFEIDDAAKTIEVLKANVPGITIKESTPKQVTITCAREDIPAVTSLLANNGVLVFAVVPTRSLEEYFLKITEGATE